MTNKELKELSVKIDFCRKCPLYKSRKNAVAGDGNAKAKIIFIGEAPGKAEDLNKKTFTGRAGHLLDLLLADIKLKRTDVFTTNLIKCRPPSNRAPTSFEISQCRKYLYKQIALIKPKIIITLGNLASKELFSRAKIPFSKMSLMHGKKFQTNSADLKASVIALYHPAAALRNPKILSLLKRDFKKNLS